MGLDPEEEVPILHLRIRKAWRRNKAKIIPVGPLTGSLAEYAYRRLETAPGHELDALAALGRARGVAALAPIAADSGYDSPHLDGVLDDLADTEGAVILVGERAPAGAIAAAGMLAEAIGGKLAWVPRRAGARGALDAGLAAGTLPGGRLLADDDDRRVVEAVWGELPTDRGRDLHAILTDAAAGKIDVLHLIGVDLVRDCASPALAAKALAKVGTVVAQDLAINETVAQADVVLPVTATQERAGSYTNWEGRTQRFSPTVDGPDLVQDDWEIVVQLAALLGHDLGWNDLDGLRGEVTRLATHEGSRDWPELEAPEPRDEGDGLALVTYPLLLDRGTMLTGADDLNATARAPRVGLNRADADALGIADGDLVEVSGNGASLTLPARVNDDVVAGAVFVPANSTDTPATTLAGDDAGTAFVTVTAAEPAEVGA